MGLFSRPSRCSLAGAEGVKPFQSISTVARRGVVHMTRVNSSPRRMNCLKKFVSRFGHRISAQKDSSAIITAPSLDTSPPVSHPASKSTRRASNFVLPLRISRSDSVDSSSDNSSSHDSCSTGLARSASASTAHSSAPPASPTLASKPTLPVRRSQRFLMKRAELGIWFALNERRLPFSAAYTEALMYGLSLIDIEEPYELRLEAAQRLCRSPQPEEPRRAGMRFKEDEVADLCVEDPDFATVPVPRPFKFGDRVCMASKR